MRYASVTGTAIVIFGFTTSNMAQIPVPKGKRKKEYDHGLIYTKTYFEFRDIFSSTRTKL